MLTLLPTCAYLRLGVHVGAHREKILDAIAVAAGSRHHEGGEARLCSHAAGGGVWAQLGTTHTHAEPWSVSWSVPWSVTSCRPQYVYGQVVHTCDAAARGRRERRGEGRGRGGCEVTV